MSIIKIVKPNWTTATFDFQSTRMIDGDGAITEPMPCGPRVLLLPKIGGDLFLLFGDQGLNEDTLRKIFTFATGRDFSKVPPSEPKGVLLPIGSHLNVIKGGEKR